MIRFLKWFFPIFAGVLIVVVTGAYWYVTPHRLKAVVQPRLSSALGREVMFDYINWGLSDGVVIAGLRVKNGEGSDLLLVAKQAQVYMSRWKLLSSLGALMTRDALVPPEVNKQSDAEDVPITIDMLSSIDRVAFQDGTLRLRNRGTRPIEVVFHYLEAALQVENGRINLAPIQGQVYQGTLTGDLAWDNSVWDGAVSLANAQAEQVVRSIGWDIPLYGVVDITAQVSGISVGGTASMAEGRIVKWDFLQRLLHPMTQWGLLPADEVPLKDVTVVFQVQDHKIILDGTKFTALDMACKVTGKSTSDGQLDYVLDVDMPIQFAGFHLGRTIPIRVKITGTANAPEVTVEIK